MKVTPLDIRRKEFKRSMRGYSDEEVDVFLDEVADEFERLFQENIEMQDRIQRLEEQIAGHTQIREALEKTLISAQLQSDEMRANARKEGELILRDAELKARQIVNDSYGETQRVQQALVQLKRLEEDFRYKFRSLLEGHLKLLAEAPITVRHPVAATEMADNGQGASEEPGLVPAAVPVEELVPSLAGGVFSGSESDVGELGLSDETADLEATVLAMDEVPTEETMVGAGELVAELTGFVSEATAPAADLSAGDAGSAASETTLEAADEEPALGSFFLGRHLDDGSDVLPAPESGEKAKGRDFEW